MTLPEPPPGPTDWVKIDRALCEAYHTTPAAIDAMTLPEIAVLCMKADAKGPPTGVTNMGDQEFDEAIRRARGMTPLDRLREARGRRDG